MTHVAEFEDWSVDNLVLTEGQATALEAIRRWLPRWRELGRPFFYLAGFAGTGKTTLASLIFREVPNAIGAAYTNRAVSVLETKGIVPSFTIHALIYRLAKETPEEGDEKTLEWDINRRSRLKAAPLLILDECSMVGEKVALDLLGFGIPILVLGDPFQLPPVDAEAGYFTKREPDAMLTGVMRQQLGNPIIEFATAVREGSHDLQRFHDGKRLRILGSDKAKGFAGNADQVICGLHATRHRLNEIIRERRGYRSPTPERGEKLICLRTNRAHKLLNGTFWTVEACAPAPAGPHGDRVKLAIRNDEGVRVTVTVDERLFTERPLGKEVGKRADASPDALTWGYAVTCHKAQASEWNNVLVIDDGWGDEAEHRCWLYTAATRAAEKLIISTDAEAFDTT